MPRSTAVAAIAAALLAGSAGAATDGNASLPAVAKLLSPVRADRPSYVAGGWVCPPGDTWRNAGRTDWLCVAPAEARRVALENQSAAANWVHAPDGTKGCRAGLVRRDAFNGDDVCVDPARRDLVRQMSLALFDAR